MTATTFDTLMYAKKLKEAGVPEKQAEAQAEALRAFEEKIEEHINSNSDNAKIEKIESNINDIKLSIARIETSLPSLATKAEMESIKTHVANSTKAIIISLILLLGGSTLFERLFPPTVNLQPSTSYQLSK
jgi:archaellum component FlaC